MTTFLCILFNILCLATELVPADTIAGRLEMQKWLYPQEKVVVTTDTEEYAIGDSIFMNVLVMDASTLQPSKLSRYVYVELTDPFGTMRKRVKLKVSEAATTGYVPLPSDLPEGTYTITGYTRFMESSGPEYFFSKPVYIYGGGRLNARPQFSFTRKGHNLRVTAELQDEMDPAVIELNTATGKSYSSLRKKRSHTFELKSEEWSKGVALAKIGNYSLYVALPPDSSNLKVRVIPEGGSLVPDIVNSIGISVADISGRGIGTNGRIIDRHGDSIAEFKTDRYGFGSFRFTPAVGESYSAEISGREYPITQTDRNAATLQVNTLRKDEIKIVPVGVLPKDAHLLIHCRGNIVYYGPVSADTPYAIGKSDLIPGINEICLLDRDLNTIARRLVFIGDSNPTDGSDELLLEAELPEFKTQSYGFAAGTSNAQDRLAIDNVMLASGGWHRYDIPSVIKGVYENPKSELEVGGEISGTVRSRWRGKPLANAEVSIISNDINYWNTVKTDAEGRFVFNGVEWPDGTKFVTKVVNSKGDIEDNYSIEEDTFPTIRHIIPVFEGDVYTVMQIEDTGIKDRLSKWLPEVEVTARKKDEDEDDMAKIYEIVGGRTVDQNYFESRNISTYEAAIRAFPGLAVQGGKIICPGGGRSTDVEIWVDGVKWTPPYASTPAMSQAPTSIGKRRGPISASVDDSGKSSARADAAARTANIMTGGLIPSDLALAQYASNQVPLSDLAAAFPFNIVDKIIYLRPASALIVSNSAGFGGGALMIFTKQKESGRHIDYDFPLKVISPLGYQE